jgi:hypothetical protein
LGHKRGKNNGALFLFFLFFLSFGSLREVKMAVKCHVLLIASLLSLLLTSVIAHGDKKKGVTYDGRSLIINGKRELLFSGSIHYPRSTPEVRILFFATKLIRHLFLLFFSLQKET